MARSLMSRYAIRIRAITFVNSAVSAVEDWEFEPVIENGVAVQKRAAVRMMFAVE